MMGCKRLFRKTQLIEHPYDERSRDKYDPNRMPPEEADAFMGGHLGARPVSMVCPSLMDDISKQLERISGIKKNARKLREEAKTKTGKAPPPDGGKGQ